MTVAAVVLPTDDRRLLLLRVDVGAEHLCPDEDFVSFAQASWPGGMV